MELGMATRLQSLAGRVEQDAFDTAFAYDLVGGDYFQ